MFIELKYNAGMQKKTKLFNANSISVVTDAGDFLYIETNNSKNTFIIGHPKAHEATIQIEEAERFMAELRAIGRPPVRVDMNKTEKEMTEMSNMGL